MHACEARIRVDERMEIVVWVSTGCSASPQYSSASPQNMARPCGCACTVVSGLALAVLLGDLYSFMVDLNRVEPVREWADIRIPIENHNFPKVLQVLILSADPLLSTRYRRQRKR